jgi:predicted small lipoprotein YifL
MRTPTKFGAVLLLVALGLLVASCGVKNDLARPDGKATPKEEHDPSKPPYPVGR